jgi:hypothetical protein
MAGVARGSPAVSGSHPGGDMGRSTARTTRQPVGEGSLQSATAGQDSTPATRGDARGLRWLTLLVTAAAVAGAINAFQRPLHVDVGFLLDVAGRVLDGEHLYTDILEPNPPLVVYLMAVPAGFARLTGIDAVVCFRAAFLLVVAASATATWWVGRGWLPSGTAGFLAAVSAAAVLVIEPGEVGQRDGAMLVLLMPYLVASGARRAGYRLPTWLAVGIGVAAGFGIALKPFFVIVLAAVEALVLLTRGVLAARRAAAVAAWTTLALYGAFVVLFHREYFGIATLAAEHYAFFAPIARADLAALALIVSAIAAWGFVLAWAREGARPLAPVLLVATAAVLGCVVLQGKGFAYHWAPAYAATLSVLALAAAVIARPGRPLLWAPSVLIAIGMGWAAWSAYASTGEAWERLERNPYHLSAFQRIVETAAPGEPVLSFWVAPGFPLVSYSSATWGSSFSSHWLLPSMNVRAGRGEDVSATRRFVLDVLDRDLRGRRPGLLLIDRAPRYNNLVGFDFLAFMQSDSTVGESLEAYRELTTMGSFVVLIRADLDTGTETVAEGSAPPRHGRGSLP